jgi:diguanylate cyclase (GGDEF)-like protein
MDIVKPNTITPIGQGGARGDSWAGAPGKPKSPAGKASADGERGKDASGRDEAYRVSILGIPAEHLTPEVDKAIETLMAEIGMLRTEYERLRERLAQFESQIDHHPILPVLSRRAFLRQLAHVIERANQLPTPASLLVLSVLNADSIRQRYGLAARDQALVHVLDVIKGVLHPTDIISSLGGHDFGIVLIVAGETVARERARHLGDAIAGRPLEWHNQPIRLEVVCGIASLAPGMDPEAAIAAADQDLRAPAPAPEARS